MNGTRCAGEEGRAALLGLLLVIMTAAAGCASVPSYKAHPELLQRKGGIRTIGLITPAVGMYEEQPRFGLNKLEQHEEWSSAAVEAVAAAFSAEMAAQGYTVVTVAADDPELKEAAELFSAVEFSIQRHAWDVPTDTMPPREPFPEKVKILDYSVGPLQAVLEKHNVDAVWVVRGFNLLPTTGAVLKEGLEVMVGILAAAGGPVFLPTALFRKIELRTALVDRNGTVLYYGVADDQGGWPTQESPSGSVPAGRGELEPVRSAEHVNLEKDLRDPRVARYYIRAALSGFREGTAP